ncbi:cytochrome P450 [Fennellomyces sp. T-0311]|nr:cytochrome P450 [Fennellomyces sp. T-0311]
MSLVLASTMATYYYVAKRVFASEFNSYKEIPVPPGRVPYFGHLFSLMESPSGQMAKWQHQLGPIMKIYMGVKPWILLGDPHLAHEIFCQNGSVTSNRPFQYYTHKHYSQNRGIIFPNPSDEWNKTRAAVLGMIAPKNVSQINHILDPEADILVDCLLDASARQGQVDIVKPLQLAAMNVILAVGVGKRAESIDDPLFQSIIHNIDEGLTHANIVKDMRTFLPAFSMADYFFQPGMQRFVEENTNPLFGQLIKDALESNVDCLVKQLSKLDHMDEKAMIVTMSDTIAAGSDTIAITLAWAIAILCRYQDVQDMLRNELDGFVHVYGRLPTFDERDHLPHFISVQKECMRYRATTPFGLLHETSKDLTCQGYFIPKGTTIVSNMRAIHMNPDVYNEPEKFMPDRFLDRLKPMSAAANAAVDERDHYNFGWGRRTCPGAYLAEVEMFNILVRLLQKSIIEPVKDESGNDIQVDLNNLDEIGTVILPRDTTFRITRRI